MISPSRLALLACAGLLAACSGSSNSPAPSVPAPVAKADSAESDNGGSVLIDVLANDEGGGSALSISAVGTPGHGSARISGSRVEYTPNAGFYGVDRFSYRISNAGGQTADGEVRVSSAVALLADGKVIGVRDEALRLAGLSGVLPFEQSLAAGAASFSVRLRSETPDRAVLLEARGADAEGLPLTQRFVSLLPPLGELLPRARCAGTACAIDPAIEPRLLLGSLPTAEYGLLRELASAEDLVEPGVRAQLKGYLPAASLLRHAALIERAILGQQRADIEYAATDTLALALSRDELAKVALPMGGQGSGSIANESMLSAADRRLAFDSAWTAEAAGSQALRDAGRLVWLEAPRRNRRFALSQWAEGRLLGHADSELQGGSDDRQEQAVFRRTDIAVEASVDAAALILRPLDGGQSIAERTTCFDDACSVFTASSLRIQPFMGDYAMLIEQGPVQGAPGEASLREAPVTLLQPLQWANEGVPERVYTALSTTPLATDSRRSRYFNEVLRLAQGGLFEFNDRSRAPPSARSRSGQWRVAQGGQVLELDDFHGGRERLWLAAQGADRGIGVLQSMDADGSRRVAAVEWLPLSDEAPELGDGPQRCEPLADGWQPAGKAPAMAPPSERFLLAADGSALRFSGTAPEPPSQPLFNQFRWQPQAGHIDFVSSAAQTAGLPGFQWWGLAGTDDGLLVHVTHTHPDPLSGSRYLARDQQFGESLSLRCSAL